MYTIACEHRFRARHRLRLRGQEPETLHEHDWKVRATVEAGELDEDGLVMDFLALKGMLGEAVADLAGVGSLEEMPEFGGGNPSTERVARLVYDRLAERLPDGVRLREITVWETADCRATYGG